MTIKTWYDPADDRMRLLIDSEASATKLIDISRNQWLSMLFQLEIATNQEADFKDNAQTGIPPRHNNRAGDKEKYGQMIRPKAVRLGKKNDSLILVFLLNDDKKIALNLNGKTLSRVQEKFCLQAERAGWDPHAGIKRLRAYKIAREAVKRIGDQKK